MKPACRQRWLSVCLLLAAVVAVARAEQPLQTAYAAILRGDYEAGRAVIARLRETGQASEEAERLDRWLEGYQRLVRTREELRAKTFDWNVEHAEQQLAAGRVYLALSFAAEAASYAEDRRAFADSPLMQRLRPQAEAAAEKHAAAGEWVKAHSFYLLLERIYEQDEQLREKRERAARHARLGILYKTDEDVERRIKDVSFDTLVESLKLIDQKYYEEPDIKKMARGALDNLLALCTTKQLYEGTEAASQFDGLADPAAREHFIAALQRAGQEVAAAGNYSYKDLIRLFNRIKEVNKQSVELPPQLLIVEFLEGALGELDEFTSVIWPADADEFDKMMIGNFVGVGIQLGIDEATERLKVVTPLEDSPALEAGIQAGDLIIGVDGESTKGWSTDKAVREITGPAGTQVTLTIYRPRTGEKLDFPLTRREIKLTTIRGVERLPGSNGNGWNFMLDQQAGIAYIRLTNFNPDSTAELHRALSQARRQGMRGLILDLRHNPGGLLSVAIEAASTFLEKGLIVRTEGRSEPPETHSVSGKAEFADLPLVILVNEHSASASEIVAGALRDHGRALVLGERTFGKGSVQRVYSLARPTWFGSPRSKARLKLTTALYYLPGGESPHRQTDEQEGGIEPLWEIALTPKEFSKVLEHQAKTFVIHNEQEQEDKSADQAKRAADLEALKSDEQEDAEQPLLSEEDIQLLRSDPFEAPDVDPQLETALLHLRVKLAANMPWPRRELARTTSADKTP